MFRVSVDKMGLRGVPLVASEECWKPPLVTSLSVLWHGSGGEEWWTHSALTVRYCSDTYRMVTRGRWLSVINYNIYTARKLNYTLFQHLGRQAWLTAGQNPWNRSDMLCKCRLVVCMCSEFRKMWYFFAKLKNLANFTRTRASNIFNLEMMTGETESCFSSSTNQYWAVFNDISQFWGIFSLFHED